MVSQLSEIRELFHFSIGIELLEEKKILKIKPT